MDIGLVLSMSCTLIIYVGPVRLFADDTTAYLAIESNDDVQTLQHDLNLLAAWEHKWQIEFIQGNAKSYE